MRGVQASTIDHERMGSPPSYLSEEDSSVSPVNAGRSEMQVEVTLEPHSLLVRDAGGGTRMIPFKTPSNVAFVGTKLTYFSRSWNISKQFEV